MELYYERLAVQLPSGLVNHPLEDNIEMLVHNL